MRLLKAAFAALVFFLLFPVFAFAQTATPPDTVVNVGALLDPWLQLLLGVATIIIPAVATWAAAELRRRTGIAIEQAHMTTFQQALANGAGLLLAKTSDATHAINLDIRSALVKEAILYVNRSAPDAIKYFGVTPDAIAEKLIAKLGLATAAPAPAPVVENTTIVQPPVSPSTGILG